jgi:hypothetical protein
MSLLASLSSSSFFLSGYLTQKINENNYSHGQFSHALLNNNIAALKVQERKAKFGSDEWVSLNRKLARTQRNSALKVANWYQKLAKEDVELTYNLTAIMWFEQAIRLHSQEAVIELAQLYFEQGKPIKSKETLSLYLNNSDDISLNEDNLILRIKIAMHLGNVAVVKQLVSSDLTKLNKSAKAKSLLIDLARYSVSTDKKENLSSQSLELLPNCISSLQLFATNLAHLKHLEQVIQTFKVQQPLAPYICLPPPKYISRQLIDCSAERQHAISCEESLWQKVVDDTSSRHIGLMLEKGGANVHLGMMYFDTKDDVNVFSHEISHLLGFVDEYPLIKTHNKCQGPQQRIFSHNIVVLNEFYQGEQQVLRNRIFKSVPWAKQIKASTPILQRMNIKSSKSTLEKKREWRLGTPVSYRKEIGLHMSESCQNANSLGKASVDFSAYKPVSQRTQLRYYDDDFPREYLNMLSEKPSSFLMPSFHYNIALALYQQGRIEEAKRMFAQAALWEEDPRRKIVILNGTFK